jgi:protein subunit release factor B
MSNSGALFPVSSDKANALRLRMAALQIQEEDLDESFVRSSGKGGQNVNKVATCVVLVHRPTGTSVKCQQERSQGLNRYLARKLLADRIEADRLGRQSQQQQESERIRRQKRRRSRRAKNRMLADKRVQGAKKVLRAGVGRDE